MNANITQIIVVALTSHSKIELLSQSMVEVRDSRTGYLIPVRNGMGSGQIEKLLTRRRRRRRRRRHLIFLGGLPPPPDPP